MTESSYGSETSSTLPLDVCQTCLELLNTAGALTVPTTGTPSGRRLMQGSTVDATTSAATLCPFATPEEPGLPTSPIPPDVPFAVDDYYTCPFNKPCPIAAPQGVSINDNTTNTGAVWNVTGVVTPPTNGTVVLYRNGSFVYTPGK